MDVSRPALEQIYDDIVNSSQWKLPWPVGPHPQDKTKVVKRRAGTVTALPSGRLARAAWRVAALLAPVAPPPPPPPPPHLKVAPRVAYKQDGSDARFCLVNQPGVVQIGSGPNAGKYTDESGAIYTNLDGLDESGIRSGAPAVTGAKEIDGRPYCSLPTMGDPTKNTGSWSV